MNAKLALVKDDDLPWVTPAAAPEPTPPAEPVPRKRKRAAEPDEQPPEPERPQDMPPFPFTLLGHDHGNYYYLGHATKQLTILKASQHTALNLALLAPQSFWIRQWPSKKGFDSEQAAMDLMQLQHASGIYNQARIRGRGAWWDEESGAATIHLGDRLMIGGSEFDLHDHGTKHIYEHAARLTVGTSLRNADAVKLTELCSLISWKNPISARLLAGWIVCAHICGALRWKPNVWLLGPKESGKSTVIEKIVYRALGDNALYCLGGTTEASLRAMLRADAMPVIIDDMDSSTARARENNQAIFGLMRIFSGEGGGGLHKASQSGGAPISYKIHACYIYSGITVEADKGADISRIALLELMPRAFKKDQYAELLTRIYETLTPEYAASLFGRCLRLIPVIRKNAEVFAQAIAAKTGSRRSGDVNGHLFAGAYSLHSDRIITIADADKYVGTRDEVIALIHEEKQIVDENNDGDKCLAHLLEQVVMDTEDGKSMRASIYDLIQETRFPNGEHAHYLLRRNGIIVRDGSFYVANDHTQLRAMYERSAWPTGWAGVLKSIPGTRAEPPMSFGGRITRSTSIPMAHLNKNPAEAGAA